MRNRSGVVLSLSSACLVLIGTLLGNAQGPGASSDPPAADTHSSVNLVPAEVALTKSLDARKDQPGATFQATLKSAVHLKDGTELPKGTIIEGKIVTPDSKGTGTQLTLEFTDAKLKGGKVIPVQATIVGLADPVVGTDTNSSYDGPTAWNGTSTLFDMTGALNNIDLHSKIGDENSGTLAASGKGGVKLNTGSRISLALGEKTSN